MDTKHVDGDVLMKEQEQEKQKDGGESLTMPADLVSMERKLGDDGEEAYGDDDEAYGDDEDEDEDDDEDDDDDDDDDSYETMSDDSFDRSNDPFLKHGDPEILEKYFRQVKQSQGFDFDVFPGPCIEMCYDCVFPFPLHDEESIQTVTHLAELALDRYNKKHGKSYQFDSVEKANTTGHGEAFEYFITFKAKNINPKDHAAASDSSSSGSDNADLEIFQADVMECVMPSHLVKKVYFCRPKKMT